MRRELLDIAAVVPPLSLHVLSESEIVRTNLANDRQQYATWALSAREDGSVYAQIEQRDPVNDSSTGLSLYSREGIAWLSVAYRPSSDLLGMLGRIRTAPVWVRADDQDLAELPPAWREQDGALVASWPLPAPVTGALSRSRLLEVWVLVPDARADNPSMSFQLETLRPLLNAVLR